MVRLGCPEWNYDSNQDLRTYVIGRETLVFLVSLVSGTATVENTVLDSRSTHGRFFIDLSPPRYSYYAGNYRGSRECLIDYEVTVGDPFVGWPSANVAAAMNQYSRIIEDAIQGVDQGWLLPNVVMPEHEKLKFIVAFAAKTFVEFLDIHPYADGNGHIARAAVWTIFARFGYFPANWPIDPRPEPPYVTLITQYRLGNPEPLELHILSQLV